MFTDDIRSSGFLTRAGDAVSIPVVPEGVSSGEQQWARDRSSEARLRADQPIFYIRANPI